jgi:two-component system chemotaxis sensor kinase CheA
MEEALVALESGPENEEMLGTLFRAAHTIKGNAWSLGLSVVTELAHMVEDLLEQALDRKLSVTSELITLLLRGVDALREMIPVSAAGIEEMQPAHKALLKALVNKRLEGEPVLAGQDKGADEPPAGERRQGSVRRQEDITGWNGQGRTLRVNLDKLDELLNLTGEIAISRGRLGDMLENRQECTREEILEVYNEADHLYMDLQELAMKIRMVPVGPTLRQYVRTVRDLAGEHGKVARLVIEGADVEVDTKVIEHLRDPLTHMIRNALDHGIEPPEVRKASGKDPCGQIVLRAYHDAGSIVIQLADDGAGFSRERILERAGALGLVAEPDNLADHEIYQLALQPGLSTAKSVTDLSGRGVGMDVVQRNIETLRGSVEIESQPGKGATIRIRLPLTLAIIEGFGVGAGEETYVIPMEAILECLELPRVETRGTGGGVIYLRGEALPYFRLRDLFALNGGAPRRESVVVVEHHGRRVGIAVDVLHGESQTVIKPLGRLFQAVSGVSGSAILGNGRVALVLDVPSLLQEVVVGRQEQRVEK